MSELRRRIVHMSGGILPISYLGLGNQVNVIILLLSATIIGSIIELIRLKTDYLNQSLSSLVRDYEKDNVAGYFYYLTGMLISWTIFEPQIALVSTLCLSFSDPIGGILDDTYNNKVLKGAGVFISTLMISIMVYLSYYTYNIEAVIAMIIVASLSATYADYVTIKIRNNIVDDNFLIPIFVGISSTVTYYSITLFVGV